jgi:hypothetical protein
MQQSLVVLGDGEHHNAADATLDFLGNEKCAAPLTRFANMPPCLVGTKRGHDTEYPDGKTFDRIKLQTRRVSRRFLKRVW